LTWRSRDAILENIKWFATLDFTYDNIKTIVVWVIENYNNYLKSQFLQCFDDFTGYGKTDIVPYKSNEVWKKGNWRYNGKDLPEKYKLDYRVVTSYYPARYAYTEKEKSKTIISDLAVIANNLGVFNNGVKNFDQDGKEYYCENNDGDVIFAYRLYKNGNAHVKMDKNFISAFNLEVGRINNWLQEPEDIKREFDVPMEEAIKLFKNSRLPFINKTTLLLT
jgi:hypothetical protein